MSPEQMKQWGEDLLAKQRQQFEAALPELLAKHVPQAVTAPLVTIDFDADPEAAVKAMIQQSLSEVKNNMSQQFAGITNQLEKLNSQSTQFMQAVVPGAKPNDEFDKKPSGFGSLTWGQARQMFQQGNDLEGLKQYAAAAAASQEAIPSNQEITASKARAPSSQSQQPTSNTNSDVDLLAVMQGRMSDADYQKKYGLNQ